MVPSYEAPRSAHRHRALVQVDTRDALLQSLAEQALAAGIPGVAVGIVEDGRVTQRAGFGLADVASGAPMRTDTVFRIGSVSKTMTAIAVMQLVAAGRLALDDPI